MSWLSDLAGRAENILNKIDQNAANVLKSDNDQLIEVKTNGEEKSSSPLVIKRNTSSGSLKLTRTPKKLLVGREQDPDLIKSEKISLNVSNEDAIPQSSLSTASNSSRRSSWSSRTEGVTVIEYPISQTVVSTDMSSSIHSMQSNEDDRTELAAVKIVLAQVKSERDQLKTELAEMSKQFSNESSIEVIADLERLCNELTAEKDQLKDKIEAVATTNNSYINSISELETTVSKLHQSEQDLHEKLNWAKSEKDQALTELQQYRSRAQHTLQLKDQLIEELKGGAAIVKENNKLQENSPNSDITESMQVLRAERESLLGEVKILRGQIKTGKQVISSLESRYTDMETRFKEREEILNGSLQHEKLKSIQLEDNLQVRIKELNAVREEMTRQQTSYSIKMHERESELSKLQSKITQLNFAGSSSRGFDDRINSLTQSLVQKQNSLEAVTVERNAVRIQLEKLESQHRGTLTLLRQQQPTRIINVNDTDDDKSQVPNFMQENPFDTRVARRVKRAYSSLDSVGVQLGVFMRRYPLIRILVIVYVAVLHLWVMLVLFTSTPN